MTNDDEMMQRIETHETWLDYHLDAWEEATERGSYDSAERALETASQHAAIVIALRARISETKKDRDNG